MLDTDDRKAKFTKALNDLQSALAALDEASIPATRGETRWDEADDCNDAARSAIRTAIDEVEVGLDADLVTR